MSLRSEPRPRDGSAPRDTTPKAARTVSKPPMVERHAAPKPNLPAPDFALKRASQGKWTLRDPQARNDFSGFWIGRIQARHAMTGWETSAFRFRSKEAAEEVRDSRPELATFVATPL